ncbi:MAG: MBL fold metallo-hydrolase [Bacillota bacterium]|nr:MBL fold metallo-hydrolase [Bacillota bacterium]
MRAFPDGWFSLLELGRGVTAIAEPHHRQRVVSYLLRGRDVALLFDTGMGIGDVAALVRSLTPLPVVAVVSHSHFDHCGGLAGFAVRGAYRGCSAALPSPPYPAGTSHQSYAILPASPTLLLAEGDLLDLGDRRLEVVHVPGHSPDSIALLDPVMGQVMTGDFFYGGALYAHLPESDPTAYLASLRRAARLVAQGYDRLLCGHNDPVQPPAKLAAAAGLIARLPAGPPVGGRKLHRAMGDGFAVLARRGPEMPGNLAPSGP